MTMPKMTGDELSKKLLEIRQDLPVFLCTGYNENISESNALKLGIKKYFTKPMESKTLLGMIHETFGQS